MGYLFATRLQPLHSISCKHCGSFFKEGGARCQGKDFFSGPCQVVYCSDCANKCSTCKKYFCLKHINKHSCNNI